MRLTLFAFLAASALAQNAAAPAFEVASVKINQQYRTDDVRTWTYKIESSPGSLTMRNVSMIMLLKWAYHVERYQIAAPGVPDVINGNHLPPDSERYDVLAKASTPAKEDEMRPMLQGLLAERFKLALHRENRTLPVFALVQAKGGHKMRPSESSALSTAEDSKRGAITHGASMAELAADLSDARDFNAAVVNKTGLNGRFDFEINVKKYVPVYKPGDPPPEVFAIVQEALQQELGLKLEPIKAMLEVLVIDHLEKTPVAN